jgi:hypothetical protein
MEIWKQIGSRFQANYESKGASKVKLVQIGRSPFCYKRASYVRYQTEGVVFCIKLCGLGVSFLFLFP